MKQERHGKRYYPEYMTWSNIKNRCYNPNFKQFSDYGGRGITMADKWIHSFDTFYAYIGQKPKGMSFDRIDNNGNYEPGNVRWVDSTIQNSNRRNNINVVIYGEKVTLKEAANRIGIKYVTVFMRIKRKKISPYKALGIKET